MSHQYQVRATARPAAMSSVAAALAKVLEIL